MLQIIINSSTSSLSLFYTLFIAIIIFIIHGYPNMHLNQSNINIHIKKFYTFKILKPTKRRNTMALKYASSIPHKNTYMNFWTFEKTKTHKNMTHQFPNNKLNINICTTLYNIKKSKLTKIKYLGFQIVCIEHLVTSNYIFHLLELP